MPEDVWPEFVYGGLTVDEYVRIVRDDEDRDVKEEIVRLVRFLRTIVFHPYASQEETLRVTGLIYDAVGLLLELLE